MRNKAVALLSAIVLSGILLAANGVARAQQSEEIPTPIPKSQSTGSDLKTALDECKTHPAVTAGGTPFELCVEGYGFVKDGNRWVQKPATR